MALSNNTINTQRPDHLLRRVLPLYFVGIALITAYNGYFFVVDQNVWLVGDWLINYQGGLVRRGLLGQGIFLLAEKLDIGVGVFVYLIYLLCYGCFFWFSYRVLATQRNLLPYVFFIFSPALFLFQIHEDIGGYRKEILFLSVLAWLVYVARTKNQKTFEIVFFAVLVAFPFIILTHEMLAIWMPYFLLVYVLTVPLDRTRVVLLTLGTGLSVATFWWCLQNPGNMLIAARVGLSLSPDGTPWLSGAVRALSTSLEKEIATTKDITFRHGFHFIYLVTGALSLLAIIPLRKSFFQVFKRFLPALLLAISIAGTVVLFLIARDWGRFIYIHIASIFLVLALVGPKRDDGHICPQISAPCFLAGLFLLVTYACVWMLPHYGIMRIMAEKNYLVFYIMGVN